MIRTRPAFGPLGHLSSEDIQVAIAIDIGDLEAVAVDDVPPYQVMTYP